MTAPGEGYGENGEQERRERERPEEPVVVRDRRKIDPVTGEVRQQPPMGSGGPSSSPGLGESIMDESVAAQDDLEREVAAQSDVERQLAERTADLQRLQAEYANYRKRVDRDRQATVNAAKASVVADLLPLLDDLERAEQHGDLTGAFKSVADKLVASLQRSGLEPFGSDGEPFDPGVHEAVQHSTSPEFAGPTVTAVLRKGYRFGERVLRPAMVAVTDHEPAPGQPGGEQPIDPPVEGELPVPENDRRPGQ